MGWEGSHMGATWTWLLCDAAGNGLCELATAAGRRVTFKRNYYAEAQCVISHEDEAASLLWNAVRNTGMPTLRGYRKPGSAGATDPAVLRFNGYLAPFTEDAEEQATLSLVFRSPFGRVIGDGSGFGRVLYPGVGVAAGGIPLTYTATDAGQIAKSLVDVANTDSFTGLATAGGTVQASKTRDRTYDTGQNIGEAVVNLSSVLDGYDFVERFTAGGSTLAILDVFASLGTDRPEVRFEYGADTLSNVRSVSRTVQPPVNVAVVAGANGLLSVKTNDTSIARYGKWYTYATLTDVIEQLTLDDRANGLLRPNPSRTIQFSPDPALSPLPWDDYFLGDTVRFFARRSALAENVSVRVNAFSVVIDEEGNEAFEIPDPTTPEEEAEIRSSLSVEVTDP